MGLARTPRVDLRFFLRTPSLPDLEDVSIELFQTKHGEVRGFLIVRTDAFILSGLVSRGRAAAAAGVSASV